MPRGGDVFGKRFWDREHFIPWHGNFSSMPNPDELYTAEEVFLEVAKPYTIEEGSVVASYVAPDGQIYSMEDTTRKALFRPPTYDDPEHVLFSVVGKDYVVIQPQEVARLWDRVFNYRGNVETLGVLSQGKRMFITMRLSDRSVGGDEMQTYLMIDVNYDGTGGIRVSEIRIRVVCLNTLMMAIQGANSVFRLPHKGNVLSKTEAILASIKANMEKNSAVVDDFIAMAQSVRTEKNSLAEDLFNAVYERVPAPKSSDYSRRDVYEKVALGWKQRDEMLARRVTGVSDIYNNQRPPTNGQHRTLWDAYNAITEYESWGGYNNSKTRGSAILWGYRGNFMKRASVIVQKALNGQQIAPLKLDTVPGIDLREAFGAVDD